MPRKYMPTFKHSHIKRFSVLLNMMYKPSELAEEIGVNRDTVMRSYIPAGLPVEKDTTGHTWINGHTFEKWARDQIASNKRKKREKCPPDEAFCFSCKKRVKFPAKPKKITTTNRWLEMMQAPCPICGKRVNKARGKIRK